MEFEDGAGVEGDGSEVSDTGRGQMVVLKEH